jgi:hypothetical protein
VSPHPKTPADLIDEMDARLVARLETLQSTLVDWVGYSDKMRADQYGKQLAALSQEIKDSQRAHEQSMDRKIDELARTLTAALKIVDRTRQTGIASEPPFDTVG